MPDGLIDSEKMAPDSISEIEANRVYRAMQPFVALINCRHEKEHESVAMWKLYTRGVYGVAVQTTVGLIKEALKG